MWLLALQDLAPVPGPELMPSLWRTVGALAVVVGLLLGVLYLLRRGTQYRRGASGLAVESALGLGERRSLVIVTVEGRRLLLGVGPGHVSLVTELQQAPVSFDTALGVASEGEPS
jgi:flagellar protein FliO/FliZ